MRKIYADFIFKAFIRFSGMKTHARCEFYADASFNGLRCSLTINAAFRTCLNNDERFIVFALKKHNTIRTFEINEVCMLPRLIVPTQLIQTVQLIQSAVKTEKVIFQTLFPA